MENNRTDLRSKSNVGADLNKKMDESQLMYGTSTESSGNRGRN